MKKYTIITCFVACVMVLFAHVGSMLITASTYVSYTGTSMMMERIGSVCVTLSAAFAVVLAWLAGKLAEPIKTLGFTIGVTSGILLCLIGVMCANDLHEATNYMMRFLLILGLLLAILWLVGNMIRRHLTERK